ncbi:MAG: 50S ribosomal protein L9 [Raoultibacter sp.]|jgi:large subunit ribosomal protein L9
MKVILLQELKGKGGEGDVVDVANGFANNYLFPKKIAVAATSGNLKQLEQRKHNIEKREEERLAKANSTKDSLEGVVISIEANVGEEGQLFGSITSVMIAEALAEATGQEIDKRRIDLKSPIKTAGEHEVLVSLYRDVKTTVKLLVGAAEEAAEEAAAVEELKEIEEEIVSEAAESVKEADAAGDAEAAAEAAETIAKTKEAEEA